MARVRLVPALVCAVAAAWLLATVPAVAVADSVTGQLIRGLNRRLLYIAIPIAVLVEVILAYAVYRFRDGESPEPTRENRQLEITWTVATGLVLVFVGTASFAVLAHPYVGAVPENVAGSGGHSHGPDGVAPGSAPPEALEVVAVAEQWNWTFRYPDANVTSTELVVPTGRPVYVYVTSEDVLHSLSVPDLGLKQDAFPGQYNLLRTRVLEPGTHRLYCAEYCGAGHARMEATVRAVGAERFDAWLETADDRNATSGPGGP